ncbi:aldose 1-epimerase family protein [Pseudarthrobacter sp. NPDC058329]|uniref:aldose 1-epimerase family protein n=1 Tax=Pseudarthrobacter sp. NPDC058329 TaxID=3346448 RepID=UPI0036D95BC9
MNEYAIHEGGYQAVITSQGGALRQLRYQDRDLIVPFPAGGPIPDYRGIIAAPWPNRIADGTYTYDGITFNVAVNEPERSCALHGLVFETRWVLEDCGDAWVTLGCFIRPSPGYPFTLSIRARYRLDKDGLTLSVTATNVGGNTAPYGVCPHPYLVAGPAPLDEWTMQVPAKEFLDVSRDRLLPIATRTLDGHEFDFRTPRPIGTTMIDHAFTGLDFDRHGRAQAVIRDPGGTGVGIEWDRTSPWVQIHTADKKPPLPDRLGLAVEPMTCPPDAFNSGKDLVQLKPAGTHHTSWRIFSL